MSVLLALLLTPGASVAFGIVIFVVLAIRRLTRLRGADALVQLPRSGQVRTVRWVARGGGWSAVLIFAIGALVQARVLSYPEIAWWRYAAPLVAAVASVVAIVILLTIWASTSVAPFISIRRRTWFGFGSPRRVAAASAVVAAVLITCVTAGFASSPDDLGRYTWIEFTLGDSAPMKSTFFGWAFGLPVIVVISVLAALTFWALNANAVRPFTSAALEAQEARDRSAIAGLVVHLVTATGLLTLGAAWQLIGDAGLASSGGIGSDVGELAIQPPYGAIAPLIVGIGFLIQSTAVASLLLIGFATATATASTKESASKPVSNQAVAR